jgi:hypothetical protein
VAITVIVPPRATKLLIFIGSLVFFQSSSMSQESTPTAQDLTPQALAALNGLRERPNWLFPADECPADVMPWFEEDVHYPAGRCKPDLQPCVDRCESSDANACYALAVAVQALETDDPISEALFLRACRLGIVSGCTNRAAGMTYLDPENPKSVPCAARTFRKHAGATMPGVARCTAFI